MRLICLIAILSVQTTFALDHWETAIYASNTWHFFIGNQEPPATWMDNEFDDSSWDQAQGGIGYGDGDDSYLIDATSALYLRTSFHVEDLDILEAGLLHFDYDDGFIAFLNGGEVFRTFNMGETGSFVAHDGGVSQGHEAIGYEGQVPEMEVLDAELLAELLQEGENILAIQLQNTDANSSDLTGLFWLSFGILDDSNPFGTLPQWFYSPSMFTSSLLPIVKIYTNGQTIPDEPKIDATMGVIDNGPGLLNHISDPFTGYDGHIGIEVRGASSQMFPKKQYAVETRDAQGDNLNTELLGFPSENDWILHAPYSDKSLIRNALVYTLAAQTGHYATRTRFLELFLNDNYQGVYILMEKIKRDANRVDIATLNPDEISGDDLSGGYIVKIDKWAGDETDGWFSDPHPNYRGVTYQYHYPKEDDIATEQREYIQNFITEFEALFLDDTYLDPQDGYYDRIDFDQFVDYAIMQEFGKNVDGFRLSSFLYKDKDSNDPRLHTGPVWDFNLAFGNANYYNGANPVGWYFDTDLSRDSWRIPFWWYKIWEDQTFKYAFNVRWQELRQTVLSDEHIQAMLDSLGSEIGAAQTRNFERWPILDEWVWPNSYVGGSYANEITFLQGWINSRLTWMDSQTVETNAEIPEYFRVSSVYPNPFNPQQTLTLRVDQPGYIELKIFDIRGGYINNLSGYAGNDGMLTISWNGTDIQGKEIPGGVYFILSESILERNAYKVTLLR